MTKADNATDSRKRRSAKALEENPPRSTSARICPECGGKVDVPLSGPGGHKQFCCEKHRQDFRKRCAMRGKVIVPYAMAWRTGRPGGGQKSSPVVKEAFAELNRILDKFAEEDRKAGRPKLVDYVGGILASGFTYIDRRRS